MRREMAPTPVWGPKMAPARGRNHLRTKVTNFMTHTNKNRTWKNQTMQPMHLITTLIFILATQANTEPIDPSDIRVIDGDTIRVYHQQPNVRLVEI